MKLKRGRLAQVSIDLLLKIAFAIILGGVAIYLIVTQVVNRFVQ